MEQKIYFWLHMLYMQCLKLAAKLLPITKPTLFIGKDSLKQLCHTVSIMGLDKVLVVSDEGIDKLGFIKRLTFELERVGVHSEVFKGVVPDPTYHTVEKGLGIYQKLKCQGVIAIGGGSSIDCAKMIAAAATNKKPIKKLVGLLRVWKDPAPLFVLPTTAGTGSEVTVAAVVSDPVSHAKTPALDPKLVPIAAALDPTLMLALPAEITAQTGMDAMTHAIEAYLSRNATQETDRYAIAAIKLINENLEKAVLFGQNTQARQNMALASYYAGLAFTKASVGYVHAIAHTLGAKYGTPHGLANAVVLPHVLEYSKSSALQRLAELAKASDLSVNAGNPNSESARLALAEAFIEHVKALQVKLKLPTHLDSILEEHIEEIAKQSLNEAQWNYPVPKYMQQEECEKLILALCTAR